MLWFWFAVIRGGGPVVRHGVILRSVHRRAVAGPESPANLATDRLILMRESSNLYQPMIGAEIGGKIIK